MAVLTTLVAGLLGGTSYGGSSGSSSNSSDSGSLDLSGIELGELYAIFESVWQILAPILTIAAILSIVAFVIGGAVRLGYGLFTLNMVDGKEAKFGDIFHRCIGLAMVFA